MHNKKIVMIISLCVSLFLITAGYAVYSSNLKIEGTGSIDSNFNIEVTNIKEESKKGKAVSVTEPTYTSNTATFNTKLQRAGDNIEYLVEITNNGTIDGKINSIIVTNPSSIVKVETRGIIEGEIIKSGEVKTYIVRVYIEEDTKIEEDITSIIEVSTEITQDDNQIFNNEIDGIEENKLVIESTKEESDYTSIIATVNAKGNGLKYYYSLDGETWSEASLSNTYTFTDLEVNTRYTVYYKVEDENLNYVTDSKWINTKDIENPVITVKEENKWTTSKEVVIEYPEIEGASYYYKVEEISEISLLSEEWISTTEKKITINLNNNSTVYAKIEIDGKVLETTKEITKIDNSEPVLTLSTSKTTKSITVVANTTDDSGIDKYEYSIDGGTTWIDNDKYNNYTFKNLVHNTKYTINVRVTDKVGLTSVSEITETTNLIETPTFREVGDLNKTVTITYPEGCETEYTCSYVKDSGEDVIIKDSTVEVKFTDEGTLIAKVNDGYNYITSSTHTVTKPAPTEIEGLYIYDVNLVELVDAENTINSYEGTNLSTSIVLSNENPDSSVIYEVVLYNNSDNVYTLTDVLKESYSNESILFDVTEITQNGVVDSGEFLTVKIKFYYSNDAISENTLKSSFNFVFDSNTWSTVTNYGFSQLEIVTSAEGKSVTVDYTNVSGQYEKLNLPLNDLEVGALYQLTFTTSNTNTLITSENNKALVYGCTVMNTPATNFTNSKALIAFDGYNSGFLWKSNTVSEQTATISFIATAETMYWIWDLSLVSDKNARLYLNNINLEKTTKPMGTYIDIPNTTLYQEEYLGANQQNDPTLTINKGSFITKASYDDLIVKLQSAGGYEFINIPIVGLTKGKSYTISFDNYTTGSGSSHKYGAKVQASKQEGGNQLVTDSDYLITKFNVTNSGTITFTATAETMYWVWDCGGISDGLWVDIYISNVSLK